MTNHDPNLDFADPETVFEISASLFTCFAALLYYTEFNDHWRFYFQFIVGLKTFSRGWKKGREGGDTFWVKDIWIWIEFDQFCVGERGGVDSLVPFCTYLTHNRTDGGDNYNPFQFPNQTWWPCHGSNKTGKPKQTCISILCLFWFDHSHLLWWTNNFSFPPFSILQFDGFQLGKLETTIKRNSCWSRIDFTHFKSKFTVLSNSFCNLDTRCCLSESKFMKQFSPIEWAVIVEIYQSANSSWKCSRCCPKIEHVVLGSMNDDRHELVKRQLTKDKHRTTRYLPCVKIKVNP